MKILYIADEHSWIGNIPEHIRTRGLIERDLSKLAQHLGSAWEQVMFDLGLTNVDTDHAKMENPNSVPMQVFSALNKWRMRNPTTATLENFLRVCVNCHQCTTVNWNQIQSIVQQLN